MKIGILTFHWATNYGAVLQAYALQEYLKEYGYDVQIINYKPKKYDLTWKNYLISSLKHPLLLLGVNRYINNKIKEYKLSKFRNQYLNLTKRYYSKNEVDTVVNQYDVLISGSDQVLNPSFTMHGEKKNHPCSIYFLHFLNCQCVKIGYSVSFGCTIYPKNIENIARDYIQMFDKIGVRELTGLNILTQLNFLKQKNLTPDPTILRGISLFKDINIEHAKYKDYICVYMLRRKVKIKLKHAIYINEGESSYSMEEWLSLIKYSKVLITNSYHGMLMAILFHVPFIVDVETHKGIGMNDRFYTTLSRIGLENRIVNNNILELIDTLDIDWNSVDKKLTSFRKQGHDFLILDKKTCFNGF